MAAGGIAADHDRPRELLLARGEEPARGGEDIVGSGGERMFWRQPVLRRDHRYARFAAQMPEEGKIIVGLLCDPPPAMDKEICAARRPRGADGQEPDSIAVSSCRLRFAHRRWRRHRHHAHPGGAGRHEFGGPGGRPVPELPEFVDPAKCREIGVVGADDPVDAQCRRIDR